MASTNSAATLFSLKDEYLKAKHDARNASIQPTNKRKKLKEIIHYKKEEKSKKALERAAKEKNRAARLALTEQEEHDLARSRTVLEAKAAVYDKLIKQADEGSTNILVDFTQKQPQDISGVSISYNYDAVRSSGERETSVNVGDVGPDEVHFSNVDHEEVRSKGVGFYSFSSDPTTRKQQMDFLNSMRESTERSRELYLAAKQKRRQEKLDRLNRIRKRLNMDPLERLPNEKEDNVEEAQVEEAIPVEVNPVEDIAKTIEEKFLKREQTMWEKKVEELRDEREMTFAPIYTNSQRGDVTQHNQNMDEELGEDEESDEITNFISFVRRNT